MDPTRKHNRIRYFCVAAALAMVFMGILACVPAAQSKPPQAMQEDVAGNTNGQGQDAGVTVTGEPVSTGSPDVTEEPASTLETSADTSKCRYQPQAICQTHKSPSLPEAGIRGGCSQVFHTFCKSYLEKA